MGNRIVIQYITAMVINELHLYEPTWMNVKNIILTYEVQIKVQSIRSLRDY